MDYRGEDLMLLLEDDAHETFNSAKAEYRYVNSTLARST